MSLSCGKEGANPGFFCFTLIIFKQNFIRKKLKTSAGFEFRSSKQKASKVTSQVAYYLNHLRDQEIWMRTFIFQCLTIIYLFVHSSKTCFSLNLLWPHFFVLFSALRFVFDTSTGKQIKVQQLLAIGFLYTQFH